MDGFIRLVDSASVLVLRLVLEERWRAGGACLRPNICIRALYRSHRLSYGADFFTTIPVNIYQEAETVLLKKF